MTDRKRSIALPHSGSARQPAATGRPAMLTRWLLLGEWRAQPLRVLLATGAIALGVALGFAVDLINGAAFDEFSAAVASISGQSDLQVRGTQDFFDEALYPVLAQHDGVALASPVLELDAVVPGEKSGLKILGLDVLRAAAVAPDLIGVPAEDKPFDTLADDAIFLSPAAMAWLKVKPGDLLPLRVGTRTLRLRVAGGLLSARAGQRIAMMDLAAAQWRFERIGRLSRIDLKLAAGVNRAAFKRALARQLDGLSNVTESDDQRTRTADMSRAYRVNLNVLALVALFTGAFLVFSTQALSVIRRRHQFALLRVAGVTRRQLLAHIVLEGALLGVPGALLGLALGYALAATALHFFGADLGGGYFPGVQPSVQLRLPAALLFFALGTGVALLGGAAPAWQAARAKPAQALKSGADVALSKLATPWPALACLLAGAGLTRLPPLFGLPLPGYLAIALLLLGGIALMPRCTALIFSALARTAQRRAYGTVATLALARLANAPNQAAIALAGVLSSFSLMVAMAIMVASFRVSLDDWLTRLLAADLYVRSAPGGNTGGLKPDEQRAIAATPGLARLDFLRSLPLTLDPGRPSVILIARPIDAADPGKTLALTADPIAPALLPPGATPIWVSEAMLDLYAYAPGQRVRLPLAGRLRDCVVAGVWRDYARQFGAIQMRLADYQRLSGDREVNDVALWLRPGVGAADTVRLLRSLPFGHALEFAEPGAIRALSLTIFDRSFAVTYLLEAVAIVIGLFGVAATFSAQTLARAVEFSMLRHIGVTRRQILALLAAEGGLLAAIGIAFGFVLGAVISLILVYVVNPQSFHWSMQLHIPWPWLAAVAAALLASAALTAVVAGRHAVAGPAIRAVREDW